MHPRLTMSESKFGYELDAGGDSNARQLVLLCRLIVGTRVPAHSTEHLWLPGGGVTFRLGSTN